jgi:hypothetical protein
MGNVRDKWHPVSWLGNGPRRFNINSLLSRLVRNGRSRYCSDEETAQDE